MAHCSTTEVHCFVLLVRMCLCLLNHKITTPRAAFPALLLFPAGSFHPRTPGIPSGDVPGTTLPLLALPRSSSLCPLNSSDSTFPFPLSTSMAHPAYPALPWSLVLKQLLRSTPEGAAFQQVPGHSPSHRVHPTLPLALTLQPPLGRATGFAVWGPGRSCPREQSPTEQAWLLTATPNSLLLSFLQKGSRSRPRGTRGFPHKQPPKLQGKLAGNRN